MNHLETITGHEWSKEGKLKSNYTDILATMGKMEGGFHSVLSPFKKTDSCLECPTPLTKHVYSFCTALLIHS